MYLLNLKPTSKSVKQYYDLLGKYHDLSIDHEGAVRSAFQSLLETCAGQFDWTLINEWKIRRSKQHPLSVDGALVDAFKLTHGFWEAKDTNDDLDVEIKKKFAVGYPKDNILFQSPSRAVLYQDGQRVLDDDITRPEKLVGALKTFFEYQPPLYAEWERAVVEFQDRVPELAAGLVELIERERRSNKKFISAFSVFMELSRSSINPNLSDSAVEEMLIQHLLTERIFSKIFDNSDFAQRNVIAREIEKVIQALTSQSFSRSEFLRRLDPFYNAIESTAATIDDFSQKQGFLNSVYERFFRGFSVKVADTHGIVYTPQPIASFMVRSVQEILELEFGKSIGDKGVHLLDPFVGTGNFVVRLMQEIPKTMLAHKYDNEIHCNEVMLLPYYVASMNIEHEYFEKSGEYLPFQGICLVDTFEMADQQQGIFSTENTARIHRQNDSPIFIIIGNPPYNVGQINENDNNKNRKYETLDKRVAATYAKASTATLKKALSDPYVKAFRWATDRLTKQRDEQISRTDEGIIAFVTNSGFIDGVAFDGMRKELAKDFNRIYVLDLKGNVRKDSMRDGISIGEQHTVFGLAAMVGISITFLVKAKHCLDRKIFYHGVDWKSKRMDKFNLLERAGTIGGIDWTEIVPDERGTWLTEGMQSAFSGFMPIGLKKGKHLRNNHSLYGLFRGRFKSMLSESSKHQSDHSDVNHRLAGLG
jgi:predicted helicase